MKITNVYQALWFWANCRPSDDPPIRCSWPDSLPSTLKSGYLPHKKNTISDSACLWISIDLVIYRMNRLDRKWIMRSCADAKHYENWQMFKRFTNKRPQRYVLNRFKRRLKNANLWH